MINFELHIPIYECTVDVFISPHEIIKDNITKKYNMIKDNEYDTLMSLFDKSSGVVTELSNNENNISIFILWIYGLPKNYTDYYWYKVFSHEILHLTHDILEDRGIYCNNKEIEETYAYLNGYLFSEIYKEIINKKKEDRKK